jgi:recombination protein RecR
VSQALSIQKLLDELERMPGVGPKSAQRIAYWLLNNETSEAHRLADAIIEVKETVRFCARCFNYSESEFCPICAAAGNGSGSDNSDNSDNSGDGDARSTGTGGASRDGGIICVVSEPRDVSAIERTNEFRGVYHVLGGAISPIDGIGPEQLTVRELLERLASDEVREVLLATNPNVEGETTAVYLARLIKPLGIKTTRLASGLPVGGDLEFADEITLGRAIEARREM